MSDIRVLVVDDHAILRDGICSLLEHQPNIQVVGEASDGQEALKLVDESLPDLVLMDIAMPNMDGLEATRQIKAAHPEVRILILTQHDNREFLLAILQSGAVGYVPKRTGSQQLLAAIQSVMEEGAYLHPAAARHVFDHHTQHEAPELQTAQLTRREREVLHLVVLGKTSREIAVQLDISPKTVSVHRSNIMAKFGVHSSVELVAHAIKRGLVRS